MPIQVEFWWHKRDVAMGVVGQALHIATGAIHA